MKKIKIQSILTAVAGLFLATSCSSSFLDTEPTDAVSSDQVDVCQYWLSGTSMSG